MHIYKSPLALVLACGVALSVTLPVLAQTNTTTQTNSGTTGNGTTGSNNNETPTNQTEANDESKTEKKPEEKRTKEQKDNAELDAILLGAWVYLGPVDSRDISNDTALAAAQRCIVSNSGRRSSRNQANNAQPPTGDLVFFRTTGGIQTFDGKAGRLLFYPTVLRVDRGQRTIWGLRNGRTTRQIQFREIGSRLGKMNLMLDKDGIFLRCQNVIDATQRNR